MATSGRRAEVVAAAEALVGERRAGEAGLSPLGIQVRETQARVDGLRTRVGDCDEGLAAAEAQFERLRFEAAQTKRQLQVAEDNLSTLHARSLTSSGVEDGLVVLARDLVGCGADDAFAGLLQLVRASPAQPVAADAASVHAPSAQPAPVAASTVAMAIVPVGATGGPASDGDFVDLVGEATGRDGKGFIAEPGRGCGAQSQAMRAGV